MSAATGTSASSSRVPAVSNLVVLPDDVPSLRCVKCQVEVALQDELISRSFTGAQGRPAFLIRST